MYDTNFPYMGGHGYPQKPIPMKVHPATPVPIEAAFPYPQGNLPGHYGLIGHPSHLYPEYMATAATATPPFAASGNHLPLVPSQSECPFEARLENEDLWNRFHELGTEMIVSKTGRRMFPFLNISLRNLDPNTMYAVLLHMVPADGYRYKYTKSEWVRAGKADPHIGHVYYVHPDSPQKGSKWMNRILSFQRAKLTNNTLDQNGHIILNSMHKYNPRIVVTTVYDASQGAKWPQFRDFIFPKTSFMAVTAYQNASITQLKIDNNPFAKGFRETGQGRNKKKGVRDEAAAQGMDLHGMHMNCTPQNADEMGNMNVLDMSDQGYRSSSSMSSESTMSVPVSLPEISEISDEEIDVGKPPTPPSHSHLRLFRSWVDDDDNKDATNQRPNPQGREQTVEHRPEDDRSGGASERPKDDLRLPTPLRDAQRPPPATLPPPPPLHPHPQSLQDVLMPAVADNRASAAFLPSPGMLAYQYYLYSSSSAASSGNSYAYPPPYVPQNGALPESPAHPFHFTFPPPPHPSK
ncbi:T-box transcription factor TBX5-A-like [Macrobrachium nipponense]|uniref:T-box transcription factor TBX5-A-like n=1 Tax=Macrobrachium nipponense TaxID=159736 RepID=UPI0030C7A4A1